MSDKDNLKLTPIERITFQAALAGQRPYLVADPRRGFWRQLMTDRSHYRTVHPRTLRNGNMYVLTTWGKDQCDKLFKGGK